MCQYCEWKNEKGAKAFIRQGKTRAYIRPWNKLNINDPVISIDTEECKKSIEIDFCPFCGRKIHEGYICGIKEKLQKDGSIIQSMKIKDKKIDRNFR